MLKYFVLISLVLLVTAHKSNEKHVYECANKFSQYFLDDEPAEYGLFAGYYAPGKKAYVGIGNWQYAALNSGRLQLDPPGILLPDLSGKGNFLNDSNQVWYLRRNRHHEYKWVDSQNGEVVPYAIDFNSKNSGLAIYVARVKKNDTVMMGVIAPFVALTFYVDENGVSRTTRTGYQVLTCKTKRKEAEIPLPKVPTPPSYMISTAPTCVNKWLPYKNDDAPAKNGISAGLFDCDNRAYVGKGQSFGIYTPGRIQTTSPAGFHYNSGGKENFMANGSFYLADNPNYSYYWVPYSNIIPPNIVLVTQNIGRFSLGITRIKLNGHMLIGKLLPPIGSFPGTDGMETKFYDFDILVCDPWPKYQCTQQWKKLSANDLNVSVDGFSVDSTSFIGRSVRKCINGCDYGLGKIQAGSNGVNYLDDLTATAVFDNSANVEYLVKNPANTYKWQPSRNGVKVANALELHREGHRPFYIGTTRINDNVVVGKVRPGEGLFFIDPVTGKQQSTSSYEVFTCTSPDASNGVYKEKNDADWFGSFGCPVRKQWSFTKWRCVCRDEFKGVFAFNSAKWNEEMCSYVTA